MAGSERFSVVVRRYDLRARFCGNRRLQAFVTIAHTIAHPMRGTEVAREERSAQSLSTGMNRQAFEASTLIAATEHGFVEILRRGGSRERVRFYEPGWVYALQLAG